MSAIAPYAYLIASICFIMALRGLSHPETSRRGNMIGIIGMVIAVGTTLLSDNVQAYGWIILAIILGGMIGIGVAHKIAMTALPQLVAAFHSLVGLAAVFVAAAAYYSPQAYGIGTFGDIAIASAIEMSLGTAIGAVTFTGSIIAFAKLQGIAGSAPLVFPHQHKVNLLLGLFILLNILAFCLVQDPFSFWVLVLACMLLGVLLIMPIGGADMPVVVSMLNSYSGWAACGIGFTLGNSALIITGALVGASGAILSY
ncbi:MAG: NAD(P)(+) transhydrogenase (Re/Si-specific) subunit beta, partial [Pseudomonadota bacterium]